MLPRRKFIQQSAAAAATGLLLSKNANAFFSPTAMPPVGLQLLLFSTLLMRMCKAHMKKIADIGYKEIESAFSRKVVITDEGKGI
jgi:hypothetical protein